jgi:hypothetical protein
VRPASSRTEARDRLLAGDGDLELFGSELERLDAD